MKQSMKMMALALGLAVTVVAGLADANSAYKKVSGVSGAELGIRHAQQYDGA